MEINWDAEVELSPSKKVKLEAIVATFDSYVGKAFFSWVFQHLNFFEDSDRDQLRQRTGFEVNFGSFLFGIAQRVACDKKSRDVFHYLTRNKIWEWSRLFGSTRETTSEYIMLTNYIAIGESTIPCWQIPGILVEAYFKQNDMWPLADLGEGVAFVNKVEIALKETQDYVSTKSTTESATHVPAY